MEGIQSIDTTGISLNSIVRASNGSSRISLPVPASALQYGGFKHITLMPLPLGGNGEGVSITRLRALDTLIDILAGEGKLAVSEKPEYTHLSPEKIDSLTRRYAQQVVSLLSSRKKYVPSVSLKGLIVNGLI